MLRTDTLQQGANLKFIFAAGLFWAVVAAILTSHFRYYFGVEWRDAVKWGLGDGFVWVLLVVGVSFAGQRYFKTLTTYRAAGLLVGLALFSAIILHPASVTLLYWGIDGSLGRPFFEDVIHLASKRLLQGVLAGLLIALANITVARLQQETAPKILPIARTAASYLILKNAGSVRRVSINAIRYIESAGNYVSIYCADKIYLERTTMKAINEKLGADGFHRISRKHLINLTHILAIEPRRPKGAYVTLEGGTVLSVSRRYKTKFQKAAALCTERS